MIITLYSTNETVATAISDLEQQSAEAKCEPKLVIYFASVVFEQQALARQMAALFPTATVCGCSTAGEIVSGKMLKHSVVVMLIDEEVIDDVAVGVAEEITNPAEDPITRVFARFEDHYHTPISDLDIEKYVGIILIDGLSHAEEQLMERVGDLTDVFFIGGSAGDDLKFERTYVHVNGQALTNAAVLVLLKVKNGFEIIKTQSFRRLGKKLTASRVDEPNRIVAEFDSRPAAQVYADALGVDIGTAAKRFMRNPVGLIIDDEPYVRSPQRFDGEAMVFYCNIKTGMDLELLESTDIIAETRAVVEAKVRELGTIEGLINFHCILRTLELEEKGQTDAYGAIFSDIPMIGFSTYGEEYIGHINQTSTMLVFR